MQTQRLFEMIYILTQQGRVTAGELAARFEVSPRTIYRDVDALSAAGIPIYAVKGQGGGISLLENFVLDKSLLNEQEQREILSSLQSVLAITPKQSGEVLTKLSALFKRQTEDWLEVDFSDWGGSDTFPLLKEAILQKRLVRFAYSNSNGETISREVEPLQLRFKHRAWYLFGYCRHKGDFRLFKLSRIRGLTLTDTPFARAEPLPAAPLDAPFASPAPLLTLQLAIDASQAYRVYDEFADWQIEKQEDGSFIVTLICLEDEWIYGFILSFGPQAEVLEPARLREVIQKRLQTALQKYL